ncbi:MAG: tyrosine-type recombinase/integrase [Sphingomonas sp.]|nr:tyrosine-type recombinase/integrase [Sphingomonas sp.]
MVEAKLPYTYVVTAKRTGKKYWRFRRGDLHAALPGQPGDPAFHQKYAALVDAAEREAVAPKGPASGTVAELVHLYRRAAEYGALRPSTQLDYGKTLDLIVEELGDQPYRLVTQKMVKVVRDSYASTPRKAHKIKQMVSRLYSWAEEENLVREGLNPAANIKRLKVRQKSYTPWSDFEIELFVSKAPAHLARAVKLLLYTGQRCEDVVTMDWKQYQGAFVRVAQSKTNEPLEIATHRDLRAELDKVQLRRGPILRNAEGKPYNANALRKAIGDHCAKIENMPHRTPHGLRYSSASQLEAAGCTVGQIVSIIGHRTYQMAMKYALARRESAAAMDKMERSA